MLMVNAAALRSAQAVMPVLAKKDIWDVLGDFMKIDFDLVGNALSGLAVIVAFALGIAVVWVFISALIKAVKTIIAHSTEGRKMAKHKYKEGDWKVYAASLLFVIIIAGGGVTYLKSVSDTLENNVVKPAISVMDEANDDDDEEDDDEDN